MKRPNRWCAAVLATALSASCVERRAEKESDAELTRCTSCHGDAAREGDYLLRAAPPKDLWGAGEPSFPGVGAHAVHLYGSATHAAIACAECHSIPESTGEAGHADDGRPAELVFGELAAQGDRAPVYDAVARRCSDTYCHGDANAVWNEPRSSSDACGSCHGLPPTAPHPQSELCSACHGDVVDAQNDIVSPSLHVNGSVEFEAGPCSACHGRDDEPAPPPDTAGNSELDALGVGAHSVHLSGGSSSRALACEECHRVPETVDEATHIDAPPAEISLAGIAEMLGRAPRFDRSSATCADTFCHAPSPGDERASPPWNAAVELACTSCHGAPPALPHPQASRCETCHGAVAGEGPTIVERSRHVDGVVDVDVASGCTACHGSDDSAPPLDLSGNTSSSSPGVGAHQIHVLGSPRSRAVGCEECHAVPASVLAAGHIDTPEPAELFFAGVAVAFGAVPEYAGGACQNTYCHGGVFPEGHASGGSETAPRWTDRLSGACGSCHAMPPPPPHLPLSNCSECHLNTHPDNRSFLLPELHVDGVVTFALP